MERSITRVRDLGKAKPPKKSLADKAAFQIKSDIQLGRLLPGDTVVIRNLAKRFGMSTMPVYEALKVLCKQGFLVAVPRVGYTVPQISQEDLENTLELRTVVEGEAARPAAERADASGIEALEGLEQETAEFLLTVDWRDSLSRGRAMQLNRRFHVLVARCTGNLKLEALVVDLIEQSERIYFLTYFERGSVEQGHQEILEAVRSGNGKGAHDAMARHLHAVATRSASRSPNAQQLAEGG